MIQEKICIVLPCLNEKNSINKVITKLHSEWDIIVADGGSTDGTLTIVSKKARVINCPRPGKGNQVAFIHSHIDAAYIVMLDSDNTYPTEYIMPMLDKLRSSEYDIIIGKRINTKNSMSNVHKVGNTILTSIANILYKEKTSDLCSGYWAFNRLAWESISIRATGFDLEANLFTEANKKKLRIGSIPVYYRARQGSRPKLKFGHGFLIAKWLIKEKLWK